MRNLAAAGMLLFCVGTADAAPIATLEVTSGFFRTTLAGGTFDGDYMIAGDNFMMFASVANNNFVPIGLPTGHSLGGSGDFPAPFSFEGTTYPYSAFSMSFTHDPITIWVTQQLNSPQTSAFTMVGTVVTCFMDPTRMPCPADAPTFALVGHGTMTAEWRSLGGPPPLVPESAFFVSFVFTTPEPSTLSLLGVAIAGIVLFRRYRH